MIINSGDIRAKGDGAKLENNNKNSFNFNIPVWLIIVAWCINPVFGVVMTALRVLSESYKRNAAREAAESPNPSRVSTSKRQQTKKKRSARAASPGGALETIGGILLGLAAVYIITSIGDLSGVSIGAWLLEHLPIAALLSAAGIGCLSGGYAKKRRAVRYSRIRTLIGSHDSFDLFKLASASGTSLKQVQRDLQKMIDAGEFGPKAYIDLGTNNFMRSPEAEPEVSQGFDYRETYGGLFRGKKKREIDGEASSDQVDMDSDNDDFKAIIKEIRRLNDEIKDDAVSERIYKIEAHTKNIFEYVSAHPDAMPQIRTFLNYYLPTTLKLLESYSRIERVGVAGDNMKKSKENIESTLDMLEEGFRRQIDELFKNESLDISSDISVLETMMRKDGLNAKDDFDLSRRSGGVSDTFSDDITAGGAAAQSTDN